MLAADVDVARDEQSESPSQYALSRYGKGKRGREREKNRFSSSAHPLIVHSIYA
jgi:hypothetical protein